MLWDARNDVPRGARAFRQYVPARAVTARPASAHLENTTLLR